MNYSKINTIKKQKKLVATANKNVHKISYWIYKVAIYAFFAFVLSGFAGGIGMFRAMLATAPDIKDIKESVKLEGFQTTVYNHDGSVLTTLSTANSNRVYVEYEDIPEDLINAFVAIEDERYWTHNGIDARGILRAFVVGIKRKNFSEGASTITQQLIKNQIFNVGLSETTFMDSLKRKVQEQYLAIQLEKQLKKEDILELYLNAIFLGEGSNGVQTASETYFGKENLKDLSISECAVLAAITQSPTEFNPAINPQNNKKRKNIVLKKMLEQGMITQSEYDDAISDDVYARIDRSNHDDSVAKTYNSYYLDAVITSLTKQLVEEQGYTETQAYNAIYSGGLSIYINQDPEIQAIVDEEMNNSANYPASTSVALNYALTLQDPTTGDLYNYSSNHLLRYYMDKTGNNKYNLIYSSETTARAAADEYKAYIIGKTGYREYAESFSTTIQPQASFVIMDQKTGYVQAICGGRGPKEGNLTLDRATDSNRQPGSTFKVLSTYVPALDVSGMTLATSFEDKPLNYSNGTPVKNWYSGYRGWQTIRNGIKDSLNIVTVQCFQKVTPQVGYDYLVNMGISTLKNGDVSLTGMAETDINESMCLGGLTEGVTNLELTGAYASIANEGVYVKPTFYSKVLDHDGKVLIDNTQKEKRVMKPSTAWLITDAMKDVVKSGTGTAARLTTGMTVAGKTGTTSSNYDYWFCGFTPYYTAGIWMGYDSNTNFSNSNYHKVIWRKIMDRIVTAKGQDISADFKKPDEIVTAQVCAASGCLPIEGQCPSIRTEYFTSETVPTKTCEVHQTLTLCDETHYKATQFCPHTTKYKYTINEDGQVIMEDAPFVLPDDFRDRYCPVHTDAASATEQATEGPEGPTTPSTERTPFNINCSVQGGGTITGDTQVYPGSKTTLYFTASPGWHIADVIVDGRSVGAVSSYTFSTVYDNHSLVVVFEQDPVARTHFYGAGKKKRK